jgi:hypothetical protein
VTNVPLSAGQAKSQPSDGSCSAPSSSELPWLSLVVTHANVGWDVIPSVLIPHLLPIIFQLPYLPSSRSG